VICWQSPPSRSFSLLPPAGHENSDSLCYHSCVPGAKLITLVLVFFLTSVVSVVTGSTSLITVPVMITMGIEPHIAIATNMLALTLMSVGGSLPFLGKGTIRWDRLPVSIFLTIIGSTVGAVCLLSVPMRMLRIIVGAAMIAVLSFSIRDRQFGVATNLPEHSRTGAVAGYGVTFLLGIYGGFFSGGYVTLLTSTFVALLGMSFLQAVATTKVVNVFSSGVASLVFFWRGTIDLKLGFVLGIAMFLGGLVGGRLALQLNGLWLRRIFMAAVIALAVKMFWLW
jgi:uncharacterized protein